MPREAAAYLPMLTKLAPPGASPLVSRAMRTGWSALLVFFAISCGGAQNDWTRDLDLSHELQAPSSRARGGNEAFVRRTVVIGEPTSSEEIDSSEVSVGHRKATRELSAAPGGGPFRNTYYNFPTDAAPSSGKTLYDAQCRKIADVSETFHDSVCVQGSGRIASGQTVSFARRDCECAAVCPRTGQRICFEALDPERFPWGRGARGKPITPLVTVAVDTSVIPFGTRIFIPEAVGLPRPDGSAHDGCFVAEDRGLKVIGEHLDIFTGDPSMTAVWNARLPSNRGVHIVLDAPECAD